MNDARLLAIHERAIEIWETFTALERDALAVAIHRLPTIWDHKSFAGFSVEAAHQIAQSAKALEWMAQRDGGITDYDSKFMAWGMAQTHLYPLVRFEGSIYSLKARWASQEDIHNTWYLSAPPQPYEPEEDLDKF